MQKIPFPYQRSPLTYFDCIADKAWAVLLDSGFYGQTLTDNNRFDILSAEPTQQLVVQNQQANVISGTDVLYKNKDVFKALDFMLQSMPNGLPERFVGGLIGYLSYDLGSTTYQPKIKNSDNKPLAMAGLYSWCLITDHKEKTTDLVSWDDTYDLSTWQACFESRPLEKPKTQPIMCSKKKRMAYSLYESAFKKIKQYLKDGDCYQVNYAQKFSYEITSGAYFLYKQLKQKNNVSFGAFLNYPQFSVLSFSPECFLSLKGDSVKTYPIKGTSKRYKDRAKDKQSKNNLINSEKDKAENLMIVDLMRNDLGQVCSKGSIKVSELFAVNSYRYVHHMQSKIEAVLADNETALTLLQRCFPGGSITGAPKKRAMEIIDELETDNRELYCGSIFYMTKRIMLSSIAIRTAVHSKNTLSFWAGGGVVSDSDVLSEYQESLDKAKVFSNLVEK